MIYMFTYITFIGGVKHQDAVIYGKKIDPDFRVLTLNLKVSSSTFLSLLILSLLMNYGNLTYNFNFFCLWSIHNICPENTLPFY